MSGRSHPKVSGSVAIPRLDRKASVHATPTPNALTRKVKLNLHPRGTWKTSPNDVHTTSTPLGGSWVVISRVITSLIWDLSIVPPLMTPLITTHEPPSTPQNAPSPKQLRGKSDESWSRLPKAGHPGKRSQSSRMC